MTPRKPNYGQAFGLLLVILAVYLIGYHPEQTAELVRALLASLPREGA